MGVMIVTGGSRGIGACTARLAATRGYSVCVNYVRNHDAAIGVVESIQEQRGTAIAVQADISLETDVVELLKRSNASWDNPRLS